MFNFREGMDGLITGEASARLCKAAPRVSQHAMPHLLRKCEADR
jgi:hypothetical protein